jgi:hypothetical protein
MKRCLLLALVALLLTTAPASAEVWRYDGHTGGDIERLVVRHRSTTIVVDLHVHDLRAGRVEARFRTDQGRYRAVTAGQEIRLYRGQERITHCDNPLWMWAKYWPDRDTVRLRIPRVCFAYPSWIRTQATYTWHGRTDAAPPRLSPRISSPAGGSASRPG